MDEPRRSGRSEQPFSRRDPCLLLLQFVPVRPSSSQPQRPFLRLPVPELQITKFRTRTVLGSRSMGEPPPGSGSFGHHQNSGGARVSTQVSKTKLFGAQSGAQGGETWRLPYRHEFPNLLGVQSTEHSSHTELKLQFHSPEYTRHAQNGTSATSLPGFQIAFQNMCLRGWIGDGPLWACLESKTARRKERPTTL